MPRICSIATPPLLGGGIVMTSYPRKVPISGSMTRGLYAFRSSMVIGPPCRSITPEIATAISPR